MVVQLRPVAQQTPPAAGPTGPTTMRRKHQLGKSNPKARYIAECASLRSQIADLQAALRDARKRHRGPLSWEDVSVALRDGMIEASLEHAALGRRVSKQKAMIDAMHRWVMACVSSVHTDSSLREPTESWHSVTLFADTTRSPGMRWILQHLHVQADRVFHNASYGWDDMEVEATVAMADGGDAENVVIQVRGHLVLPCSLARATDMLWYDNPSINPHSKILFDHDNVRYMQEDGGHAQMNLVGHVLYGRQVTPTRAMHVSRSILSDTLHPLAEDQWTAPTVDWVLLEPLDDHCTRMRYVMCADSPVHPTKGTAPCSHFGLDPTTPSSKWNMQYMMERIHRTIQRQFYDTVSRAA